MGLRVAKDLQNGLPVIGGETRKGVAAVTLKNVFESRRNMRFHRRRKFVECARIDQVTARILPTTESEFYLCGPKPFRLGVRGGRTHGQAGVTTGRTRIDAPAAGGTRD